MRGDLPKLSIGDVFDEAFDLYKRNFGLFFLISAVLYVPADALLSSLYLTLGVEEFGTRAASTDVSKALGILAALIVGFGLFYFVIAALSGTITIAASERHLGRQVTMGQAYRAMLRSLPRLLVAWLIVGAILAASIIALFILLSLVVGLIQIAAGRSGPMDQTTATAIVIPFFLGIVLVGAAIFMTVGAFVTPAIVLEDAGPIAAIQRNMELMRGRIVRLTLAYVALIVVAFSIQEALSAFFVLSVSWMLSFWSEPSDFVTQVITVVVHGLILVVVQPLWMITFTVLYYDQRVRKEGFDLALMLVHLDSRRQAALAEAAEGIG